MPEPVEGDRVLQLGVGGHPGQYPFEAPPKAESEESETRSLARVVRASCQPPSTSPTTHSSGTKQSSKKTSLNSAAPVISRSGRTSMPGDVMSTRK